MALVQKYFGFVESGENLPKGAKVSLYLFVHEICNIDAPKLEKAVRWMKTQRGFRVEKMVDAFYANCLITNNMEKYLLMAKCCSEVMSNFGSVLKDVVDNAIKKMYAQCQDGKVYIDLVTTMDLVNGLYVTGIVQSDDIRQILCDTVRTKIEISHRISLLKKLMERNAPKKLKNDHVDENLAAYISLLKPAIKANELQEFMNTQELDRVIKVLIEANFLPSNANEYDKMEKARKIVADWCDGSCSLKKTISHFSALEIKQYEQIRHLIFRFYTQAMQQIENQEKLVILQAQLRTETFENEAEEMFDEALMDLLSNSIAQFFSSQQDAAKKSNLYFIRYVILLYNRSVIDCHHVLTLLDFFKSFPPEIGHPRFAQVFINVEEKLKTEISTRDFQNLFNYMLKKVVGNKKSQFLSPVCQEWIEKVGMGKQSKGFELKRQPLEEGTKLTKAATAQAHIAEVLKGYCSGYHTLSQTLKQFERYKSASKNILALIPKESLAFALSGTEFFHEQHAELLKKLFDEVLRHRSQELHESLFKILNQQFEHFSDENYNRNSYFVRFLSRLYNKEVIDEVLIMKCFELLKNDWNDDTHSILLDLIREVDKKLKGNISAEKYEGIVICLFGNNQEEKSFLPEVKKKSTKNKKPDTIQTIMINIQDLRKADELENVVDNLRKVLNSESQIRIFIKHMIDRTETELREILLLSNLLVALAKASNENFVFKDILISTIHAEYLRTNAIVDFDMKAKAKLNRIELISGELWRNNLMATKKFAGILMSKNMRLLPTESLAHLSMIVANAMHSEGNSKLKLAVRQFEPFIHDFTMKGWSDLKDDLNEVEAELQMLLSYEDSLAA